MLIYRETDVTYTWEGQTYHLDAMMNDADIHGSWQVINGFWGVPQKLYQLDVCFV